MIKIKVYIVATGLLMLLSCSESQSNGTKVIFPVPKYCENSVEESVNNAGIENIGVEIEIERFDVNTSYEPVDKFAVLKGSSTYKGVMERIAKAAIYNCSPNSSKVFEKDHPIVKLISKELNRDISEIEDNKLTLKIIDGQLIIYFDDPVSQGVRAGGI